MPILLGAVADDFTGATDLCSMLVRNGMRTVQLIGVPEPGLDVPRPTRWWWRSSRAPRRPPRRWRSRWRRSAGWQAQGARQYLFKYCSTFDSTDEGNIGPVADALLDALGADFTIACPAFPETGRTIFKGHLFVGDLLLSDTHMRHHPLTPMTDANLVRVLQRQTARKVGLVPFDVVQPGPGRDPRTLRRALRADGCAYAVTDVLEDEDLRRLGTACADLALLTGGSGIAMGLPENFRRRGLLQARAGRRRAARRSRAPRWCWPAPARPRPWSRSRRWRRRARRCGSTRCAWRQAGAGRGRGLGKASRCGDGPVLVYASATPEEVERGPGSGWAASGPEALVEAALADVARGWSPRARGGWSWPAARPAVPSSRRWASRGLAIGPMIDPGVPGHGLDRPRRRRWPWR